jgi:hypothetical protein
MQKGPSFHPPFQTNVFSAIAFNAKSSNSEDEFRMDSFATYHLLCDHSFPFNSFPKRAEFQFAKAKPFVEVAGIGTRVLYNHVGRFQCLKDVFFVPSFGTNLISVSRGDAHGALHSGGIGAMEMRDASETVLLRDLLRDGL